MTNTYTLDQLDGFPWIVSTDTLKTEDLLPKFWIAAERLVVLLDRSQLLNLATVASLHKLVGCDSREADWSDGEAAQTLEDLHEALAEVAPAGFYFGSQEGDGACFGFWLEQDWADALEHCGVAADSDSAGVAHIIGELADLGYDPDNLRDCYSGEAEGYTEAEAGADAAAMIAEELVESAQKRTEAGWPFRHIDWEAAWEELRLSDNYQVVQWSHARWLVLSGC